MNDHLLEQLKETLAEAEDLFVEFAIELRREAHRAKREWELRSQEMAEEDSARRAARQYYDE